MTEEWIPKELSPEEENQWQEELDAASEDEPPQLNPNVRDDPDDPPQIDRRTTAEKFSPDSEPTSDDKASEKAVEQKKAADDAGAKEATETAKDDNSEAQKEPESKSDSKQSSEPDWMLEIPEPARKHIHGLQGTVSAMRDRMRAKEAEAERRFTQMAQSFPKQIQQAVAEALAAQNVPDPDLDPDGHRRFLEQKVQTYEQRDQETTQEREAREKEEREFAQLNDTVVDHEVEYAAQHPDYWEAKQHALETGVKYFMDEFGVSRESALGKANEYMVTEAQKALAAGGNVAHRFYRLATTQFGWGQQQTAPTQQQEQTTQAPAATKANGSASDAETIAAGQKASRGLGRGGSGTTSAGKHTPAEIWNIKDPDEFERAYSEYLAEQTGNDLDWTP